MNPNQCRTTPDDLFQALERRFGAFDLDAAASADNARCEFFIDEITDALSPDTSWVHNLRHEPIHNVFCNPPWQNVAPWYEKAFHEAQKHPDAQIVLVTLQTWAKRAVPWIERSSEYLPLVGRPMFKIPEGWYKCKVRGCRHSFKSPLWPSTGPVVPLCPLCEGRSVPQLNSSPDQDIQVVIFRHNPDNKPPKFEFWDWKNQA